MEHLSQTHPHIHFYSLSLLILNSKSHCVWMVLQCINSITAIFLPWTAVIINFSNCTFCRTHMTGIVWRRTCRWVFWRSRSRRSWCVPRGPAGRSRAWGRGRRRPASEDSRTRAWSRRRRRWPWRRRSDRRCAGKWTTLRHRRTRTPCTDSGRCVPCTVCPVTTTSSPSSLSSSSSSRTW